MSSPFAAHPVGLGRLFADPFIFAAPAFQRSYAWTAAEAGRLFDEILAALDAQADGAEGTDCFLGTMLFMDGLDGPPLLWPPSGPPRPFEVIDGQQRLTTLTILFCLLRDLDAEAGVSPDPRLREAIFSARAASPHRLTLRGGEEAFFEAHIRTPPQRRPQLDCDALSPSEARLLEVREHLAASLVGERERRRRLVDFLFERCHVVAVATRGIDRAHRMFMVLNDSGKPLARNDILKAELLGATAGAVPSTATAVWDGMEAQLGAHFEVLFSHVRSIYGRPGAHVIASIRALAAEWGDGAAFIETVLHPAATAFDAILNARHSGSPHSPTIAPLLRYLGWLPAADWVPCAILGWLKAAGRPGELAHFLAGLDRLAYALRILGIGANRRAQRFGALLTAMRRGDLKSSSSQLALSGEELRSIAYNLRDLHLRSAPMAKLVLLRINDRIAETPQNLAPDELTVEHVLPRKVGPHSQWRAWFPSSEERERCTHSLGNLVLVSKAQNDRAGNLEFTRKHAVYFETHGAPRLAINEGLRKAKEWRPAQILAREANLLELVEAVWNFGVFAGGLETGVRRARVKVA